MFLVQRQRARNTAVKAGIHHIQVGVQAAAADNDDKYPSPMAVQPTGSVAKYVSPWPKNPWTGAKMARYPNDGSMPGMASELGWTGAAKSHKGNYMYWFAGSPDPEEAYKLRGAARFRLAVESAGSSPFRRALISTGLWYQREGEVYEAFQ